MAEKNYSSCCRLCLSEDQRSLRSVFDDASGCQTLVTKISTFVGIMIYADDKISTMICSICIQQIDSWLKYRESCTVNQLKLNERYESWNGGTSIGDVTLHIKDEPEDDVREMSDGEVDVDHERMEVNLTDLEPIVQVSTVKSEPYDPPETHEQDLPPSLTPQKVNGMERMSADVTKQKPKSNKCCSICNREFSTSGNRRKHEKTMHKDIADISVQSLNNSINAPQTTVPTDPPDSTIERLNNGEVTIIKKPSNKPPIDREKLAFAAGLKLRQRNATSQEGVIIDANGLTRIELSYIEKCKSMVIMFDTMVCACHNVLHRNMKRLLSHLRSLKIWFPVFTCYNCMITFTDRSTSMRHRSVCQRKPLQHLIRLSELRKNDAMKRRLYQIFKCVRCNFLFSFYEDYCAHVTANHVPTDAPYLCMCQTTFETQDDYIEHIQKSCFLTYYCDICFAIIDDLETFEKHCKDVHDISDGFVLHQEDNYQPRKPRANNDVNDVVPAQKRKIDEVEEDGDFTVDEKVLNPHAVIRYKRGKNKTSSCPICGRMYSNYHNMLRHCKTHDEGEKNIGCTDCGEKFRLSSELKQHRAEKHTQHSEFLFSCPDCGTFHQGVSEWEEHKNTHETTNCEQCGKPFIFKTELDQHRCTHLNLKVYRDSKTKAYRSAAINSNTSPLMCEICDKIFDDSGELKRHKVVVHNLQVEIKLENGIEEPKKKGQGKKYSCTLCNKHYLGYGGLWDHNRKKHPGRQIAHDYPRQCKYCDKLLYTGGSWVIHKRMHERLKQIEQQASTSNQDELKTNLKVEQPQEESEDSESYYTCKKCFKVFSNKSNLKNHMKSHGVSMNPTRLTKMNKQQVWCDICHQACQGQAELKKHKEEHENENMPELVPEVEEKMVFTCDLCRKAFPSNFSLMKHKEAHASELANTPIRERPKYVYCKYCKIPFAGTDLLTQHLVQEHDEKVKMKQSKQSKKYACNLCKKVFDTAGGLCSHQGWHKRGKTEAQIKQLQENSYEDADEVAEPMFSCQKCSAEFSNDTALQIHILEKHRNVNATVVPPRCSQCNVDFNSHEAYEKHKQLHAIVEKKKELKQHPCQYCPAGFSRSDTLNTHIRVHHKEYFATHFKCHVCERVFEKQNALTIHLKTHDRPNVVGQKSLPKGLSCSICKITFADSKDLRKHVFSAHPF